MSVLVEVQAVGKTYEAGRVRRAARDGRAIDHPAGALL
jgi:hypothetical protein